MYVSHTSDNLIDQVKELLEKWKIDHKNIVFSQIMQVTLQRL